MTPQTEVVTLNTTQPTLLKVSAYGANTLRLSCVGDLSTGFDTLKAELHETRTVGGTPLAEVEYVGALGAGPHVLEFTAAQMNQMPNDDRIRTKAFYLVVLGRNGSGASIVKTTLANIELTLWQSPAGDTAPAPPAPATYATEEYVDDAIAGHAHSGGDITSGTVALARLPASYGGNGVADFGKLATFTAEGGIVAQTIHAEGAAGLYVGDGNFDASGLTDARAYTLPDADGTLSLVGHTHEASAITSGTFAIATISGLQTALDGKAASSHSHAISDVTGLQVALDAKDSNLNDALESVQTALDAKLAIAGGTMTGSLMFTDASYDIGGTDVTRPRDLRLSRNALIGSTNTVTTTTHSIVSGTGNTLSGNGPYNLVLGTNNALTLSGGYGHSIIAGPDNVLNTSSAEYGWRGQNLIVGNLHQVIGECAITVGFHNRVDGRGTFATTVAGMLSATPVTGAGGRCMTVFGAGGHAYWGHCVVICSHGNVDHQKQIGDVSMSSASVGAQCPAGGSQTAELKLSNTAGVGEKYLILHPNRLYKFRFKVIAGFITGTEWGAAWEYDVVVHQGASGTTPLIKEIKRIGQGRGSQNGEVPYGWSVAFTATAQKLVVNITMFNPFGSAAAWVANGAFEVVEVDALYGGGGGPLKSSIRLDREDISSPESVILRDDFVSKNVTSNTVGELGWTLTTMTSVAGGSVLNHPGIQTLTQGAGSTGLISLNSLNTPIGAWDLTTQEWVFRVPASVANLRVAVGLMRDVATYASGGARILVYDQALSANWRLLHYDGNTLAATYTDTGVAFVANDWVHVKLAFSGTATTATIRTTTYPTPVTVSSTAAATTSANAHCPALMIYNPSGGAITVNLDLFGLTGPTSRI